MTTRIPPDVLEGVTEILRLPSKASILGFSIISGGCINNSGRIKCSAGDFFLKWNDRKRFPKMFEAESRGLKLLAQQEAIRIPRINGYGETDLHQFLVLEYIEQKGKSGKYWEQLGIRLAKLHNATNMFFGLDHNNYIGSLNQSNSRHSSWVEFFIEERLNVQLKLAVDSGLANANWTKKFQTLYKLLPALLPEEKPSLLHGDLWSGNLITDEKGEPCLIDPAVYFGNREVDLAMTSLFGGFADQFYEIYEEHFPLQPDFRKRRELYNLYPLLVHVNLFGGSYVGSVEQILKNFT
jgi:fructosamine-3-kinase